MKAEIVVTWKLITFLGLFPLSHTSVSHSKKADNCFRVVVASLMGEILRNGPGGRSKLKQKQARNNFIHEENTQGRSECTLFLCHFKSHAVPIIFEIVNYCLIIITSGWKFLVAENENSRSKCIGNWLYFSLSSKRSFRTLVSFLFK